MNVKRALMDFSGRLRYTPAMRVSETLDDLLLAAGRPLQDIASEAGINNRTLWSLRNGLVVRPRVATLGRLAKALGVEPARVRAAIQASAARKKD